MRAQSEWRAWEGPRPGSSASCDGDPRPCPPRKHAGARPTGVTSASRNGRDAGRREPSHAGADALHRPARRWRKCRAAARGDLASRLPSGASIEVEGTNRSGVFDGARATIVKAATSTAATGTREIAGRFTIAHFDDFAHGVGRSIDTRSPQTMARSPSSRCRFCPKDSKAAARWSCPGALAPTAPRCFPSASPSSSPPRALWRRKDWRRPNRET